MTLLHAPTKQPTDSKNAVYHQRMPLSHTRLSKRHACLRDMHKYSRIIAYEQTRGSYYTEPLAYEQTRVTVRNTACHMHSQNR